MRLIGVDSTRSHRCAVAQTVARRRAKIGHGVAVFIDRELDALIGRCGCRTRDFEAVCPCQPCWHRIGNAIAIPITIELREISRVTGPAQYVEVREIRFARAAEIFVAQVAATDDRTDVIGNPCLVVHTAI